MLAALLFSLAQVISAFSDYGFSGDVLVERHGKIVFHRAYGLADKKSGIANTTSTRFPIASITKSFTAAAVMQLASANKIALADPISKYFADLPADRANITIEQLLLHTSGLPEDENDFRTVKLDHSPGVEYSYSNLGYRVLAQIVEKASGESFRDYVTKHVIAPAKLTSTSFEPKGIAIGYAGPADDPQPTAPPTYENQSGSGSLFSTSLDLLAFAHALQRGKIVDKRFVDQMMVGDPRGPAYGWWSTKTESGHRVFDNGGDWDGYQSNLRIYPDDDLIIILLTNTRPNTFRWSAALIRNLERELFGHRAPVVPPHVVASNEDLSGSYETPNGDKLEIKKLAVSVFGQNAIDLLAFPRGKHPDEMNRTAAMSLEVIDALRAADAAKIGTFVESASSTETFAQWWAGHRFPSTVSATILGTAPKGPSRYETFVRTDAGTLRVVWRRGTLKLVAVGTGVDIPYGAAFRPIGKGKFASFDVPAEEIVTLEKRGDDVVLKRGDAELIAHKIAR